MANADSTLTNSEAELDVTYYTDPLCCWSWAFEPVLRRFRYEFGPRLQWQTRLGGLIPDWTAFEDPLNSVARPSQMGPHWYQVALNTGMPIDDHVWLEDPPASSYPACVAVKAIQMQGLSQSESYLRRLREAVMLERRNIARRDVLIAIAEEQARDRLSEPVDMDRFVELLGGEASLAAFREDLQDVRYRGIGRFPALIIRAANSPAIMVVGYRPYELLLDAVHHVRPDLSPSRQIDDLVSYVTFWGSLAAPELAEAMGSDRERAQAVLDGMLAEGQLTPDQRSGLAGRTLYRAAVSACRP